MNMADDIISRHRFCYLIPENAHWKGFCLGKGINLNHILPHLRPDGRAMGVFRELEV